MRYARKDIKEIKSRTKILKWLWRFFGDTMEKVSEIKEFSVDLKRYREIDRALWEQSWEVSDKIESILGVLQPILEKGYVSGWTELRVRLEWLFRNREELRLLHVDMDLLTRYMDIFSNLVQMRIAVQQYTLTKSAATKIQIDGLEDKIDMALEGVRQVQRDQESRLPASEGWQKQVRHEVKKAMIWEASQIKKAVAGNGTSSGSSSGLSPPVPSPSTPPTTPSSQSQSPIRAISIIEQSSRPASPLSERTRQRNNRPGAVHAGYSLDSEVSYVSSHQGFTTNSGVGLHPPCPAADGEDEEAESEGEGQGIYMPTALFGPPRPRRRVRPARVSTTGLNHDHRISSISPVSKSQEEGRPRSRDTSTSSQRRATRRK
ncbi:uncharacterized protein APUU_50079A [Aspergillus puulaauensis]|uniref:Uncharacterized protein n=1 Tax=Aspergillus puulaauensis TaxID=1220207 RepID=A0A7R7XR12_9EURO|nr:uncharacterized protein APUU_50079A [Aspergillus puulaauensis]BCS25368.1 hypothetical protein APUU_50079A [Aspergillus puulaauensis]